MPLDSIAVFSVLDRVTNSDGTPVSEGTVEFYLAGTSTPLTVYSDYGLTTSLGATVSLNSAGYPVSSGDSVVSVYTGTQAYKIIVKDADGVTLTDLSRDNIRAASEIPTSSETALPEVPVVVKTSSYSVVDADQGKLIVLNCTGGTFLATLPSAVTVGDGWSIGFLMGGSANTTGFKTTGGETVTIRGKDLTSVPMTTKGTVIWVTSDGANWRAQSVSSGAVPGLHTIIVTDRLTAPPSSPIGGAAYIINGSPTGAWSTLSLAEDQVAIADGNGSWIGYTPSAGWRAYVVDEGFETIFDGTSWVDQDNTTAPAATTLQAAVFEHSLSNGTVGGTATTGAWTARTLNTTQSNTITGCSLATNQITLPVGTYQIGVWQSFFATSGTQSRIKVISGTATPDPILNGYSLPYAVDSGGHTPGHIAGAVSTSAVLTVTATAVIELQYWVAGSAGGTSGLGSVSAEPTGSNEVYARVVVLSLAAQQGPTGAQGTQGTDGLDAAFDFQWNTATSGDPGSGKILLNNATFASATQLNISETTASGADIAAVIATWDDSTSSVRGQVKWSKEGSPGIYRAVNITGAGTDQGTYWTFPITPVDDAGSLSNADALAVLHVRTGDKGDTGATGAAGANGATGATGAAGSATSNSTFLLTGIISPSQITSDQNDYNPTGLSTASTIRLSTDASRNITGLAGGADGRVVILHNVGSQNAVLKDESSSSSASNRFALASDVVLLPDAVAVLQYDATSSRWRAVSGGGSANPTTDDGQALGTTALKWSDLFLASGAVINFNSGDVTITHSTNALTFQGADNGYLFSHAPLPQSSDVAALGSTANMWSDLFLASGAVINFNAGNVTLTHSANALAFAGASSGYSFDAAITTTGLLQAGTTLGISTDVRLNRDAANTLALRNSTSAQTFREYATYTDASNGAWAFQDAAVTTAATYTIGTSGNGTGASTLAKFQISLLGTVRADYGVSTASAWTFSGRMLFNPPTDTTIAFGIPSTSGWYFSSGAGYQWNFTSGGTDILRLTGSGVINAAATVIYWTTGALGASVDIALARSAAGTLKITDGSTGFGSLHLGGTSAALKVGTHSAIAAETVTGYITIKDSGGTDRKIAVVS